MRAFFGLVFTKKVNLAASSEHQIRQNDARKYREAQPVVDAKRLEAAIALALADQPAVPHCLY